MIMGSIYFNFDDKTKNEVIKEVLYTISDNNTFDVTTNAKNSYVSTSSYSSRITLTLIKGYRFTRVQYQQGEKGVYGELIDIPFDKSGTFFVAEFPAFTNVIKIEFDTEQYTPEPEKINITFTNENVTGKLDGVLLKVNSDNIFNVGVHTVVFTAKLGYVITNAYFMDSGVPTNLDISSDGKSVTYVFNESHNKTYPFTITTVKQQNEDVTGFNHLYKVDKTILKSISLERFATEKDLGQYMLNVLELPFTVSNVIEGELNNISLGNFTLKVQALELTNDSVLIDVGNIFVPSKYHNSYDYKDTVIKLHLPYIRTIEIDTFYVINQTISIHYIIDLYSGGTTVNIISDKVNKVIHSERVNIGRNIPFISPKEQSIKGYIQDNQGLENGVRTAFIEVIRNVPSSLDTFSNEMVVQSKLEDVRGYVSVSNILLNTNANFNEKNSIIQLLKDGVYIK